MGADLFRQAPKVVDEALVLGSQAEGAQVGAEGAPVVLDFGLHHGGGPARDLDLFLDFLGPCEELALDVERVFPAPGDLG